MGVGVGATFNRRLLEVNCGSNGRFLDGAGRSTGSPWGPVLDVELTAGELVKQIERVALKRLPGR